MRRMVGTGAERSCKSRKSIEGGKRVMKRENRVTVALQPQLARRYVSRVAARNPGNAEHGDLNHNVERGGERARTE